jgi:YbbR domain-containing protein
MKDYLNLLFSNLTWKIISLVMAIGLWGLIHLAVIQEDAASRADEGPLASREIQNVPIIVQTSSTDTNRYTISPQIVKVSIQGESTLLSTVDASRIRVVADMTQQTGEDAFAVALEVVVPPEFEFQRCVPQSIRVEKSN